MKRTTGYYKTVEKKMEDLGKTEFSAKFAVEIDEWKLPPLLEFARAASDLRNPTIETKMMVFRYGCLKKAVKVFYDGKLFVEFQANDLNFDFELIPQLKGPAILFLLNQAWYNLLEKCLPPQTDGPAEADLTGEPSASSKKR